MVYKLPAQAMCFSEYANLSVSTDNITATISKWDKVLSLNLINGEIQYPENSSHRIYLNCKTLYVS